MEACSPPIYAITALGVKGAEKWERQCRVLGNQRGDCSKNKPLFVCTDLPRGEASLLWVCSDWTWIWSPTLKPQLFIYKVRVLIERTSKDRYKNWTQEIRWQSKCSFIGSTSNYYYHWASSDRICWVLLARCLSFSTVCNWGDLKNWFNIH